MTNEPIIFTIRRGRPINSTGDNDFDRELRLRVNNFEGTKLSKVYGRDDIHGIFMLRNYQIYQKLVQRWSEVIVLRIFACIGRGKKKRKI